MIIIAGNDGNDDGGGGGECGCVGAAATDTDVADVVGVRLCCCCKRLIICSRYC